MRLAGALLVCLVAFALLLPASVAQDAPVADVRATLLAIPGVRTALQSGEQRKAAVLVNRWLAPRLPAAHDANAILSTFGADAHELFAAFAAGRGGVYCDGAADALVASLRLLGIEASRFDFGHVRTGLTHTTVVVRADDRYWLVDPTFALDLRDAHGRPLDLLAAWRATSAGREDAIVMRTADLSARRMVGGPNDQAVCGWHPHRWTMCALPTYLRVFAPALRRAGYPAGERGLLLLSLHGPWLSADVYGVVSGLERARAQIAKRYPLTGVAASPPSRVATT